MFFMKIIFSLFVFFSFSSLASEFSVSIIDVPPFGLSSKNIISGIHTDFIKKILKKCKLSYSLNILPYPRVIKNIQDNTTQLSLFFRRYDLEDTIEVDKSIGFYNYIVSHVDRPINKVSKLRGKVIGVIRNAKYEDNFDRDKLIKKMQVKNYEQGLDLLKLKRIDGLIISEPAYYYYLKKYSKNRKIFSKPIILNKKYNYLYVNKSVNLKTVELIKKANREVLNGPYLEYILNNYR